MFCFTKKVLVIIFFSSLIYFVFAQYTPYHPPYSAYLYKEPPNNFQSYNKVHLHKLCSWNVVEFDQPSYRNDSWNICKIDAGRNYIPENNIPTGIRFDQNGRCFVSLRRGKSGVYTTLAYFYLDEIKNGRCPPLRAYPSDQENTLNTQCCTKRKIVNIERFNIDKCNRLWAVDKQTLDFNEVQWKQRSPRLYIFDLHSDRVHREVPIPAENYDCYVLNQKGFETVVVNVDPHDCENAFGYIIDSYHGSVIVYSYKENKFWTVWSPEFYGDAKYSKFTIKTRRHKEVTYYKKKSIYDCTRDLKRDEVICHSVSSLDEIAVPIYELENEEIARCSPNSLNVKFLGQKCRNCQTGSHVLNPENQVVWGAQELNYGFGCWNRENPLRSESVHMVVSDLEKLPYVSDLTLTKEHLPKFGHNRYYRHYDYHNTYSHQYNKDETYVVVLSNNLIGIEHHGFDHYEENFGIYYVKESEALHAFPQCLADYQKPEKYHEPKSYKVSPPVHPSAHYQAPTQVPYLLPTYTSASCSRSSHYPKKPQKQCQSYKEKQKYESESVQEPKPVPYHRYKKNIKK